MYIYIYIAVHFGELGHYITSSYAVPRCRLLHKSRAEYIYIYICIYIHICIYIYIYIYKSLGHPAKAPNLKNMKLGFHPYVKPACPRGGSPNDPTLCRDVGLRVEVYY